MDKKIVDELKLPSADALAIVACNLARHSKFLQDNQDLFGAFWYFYDQLATEAERRKAAQNTLQEHEKRQLRHENYWKQMKTIITPLLDEAKKRGLTPMTYLQLMRAYGWGEIRKLPADLSDDELMVLRHWGQKSLANFRSAFPLPS